jgi:hypothetical protein
VTGVAGQPMTVPFLKHRVNAQYSIEGLSAGFLFLLGGQGLLLLDWANQRHLSARHRTLYLFRYTRSPTAALRWWGLFMSSVLTVSGRCGAMQWCGERHVGVHSHRAVHAPQGARCVHWPATLPSGIRSPSLPLLSWGRWRCAGYLR